MERQILVIDDDDAFRATLIETIRDLGYASIGVSSIPEALKVAEATPLLAILVDFKMPQVNGVQGIPLLRSMPLQASTPIAMITSYLDASTTIQAVAKGAFEYLTKPISKKQIGDLLARVQREFSTPTFEKPAIVDDGASPLVYQSRQMREVMKTIGRIAATNVSTLITGETGTGKERVARLIHEHSLNASGPFVALNCAAIPENLLESELFGYTRGAFTGANGDHSGKFLAAQNGTIFLDEIGDMSFALQCKLLRVLEEREVTPVGSSKNIKVNARFISATHQPLRDRVRLGRFREDLYFRLNVIEIQVPPLRERVEDIAPLASSFLKRFSHKQLAPEALCALEAYAWPGNVRELKNVIEHAAILTAGSLIRASHLKLEPSTEHNPPALPPKDCRLPEALAKLESTLIERALRTAAGNRSEAARALGISRQVLYSKIKFYGLDDALTESADIS